MSAMLLPIVLLVMGRLASIVGMKKQQLDVSTLKTNLLQAKNNHVKQKPALCLSSM